MYRLPTDTATIGCSCLWADRNQTPKGPEICGFQALFFALLCYTSPVLKEDLVLTGDMTAELYISSDAPDTDFVVRVTDVDENGRSIKLADGLLSARYRNGFARSEFLQEGEIVCLKIRTTKLSNCFRKGHRIRVTVTSSAKNFIFPNSNTREGFASARTVVAHNRVYHGGLHASRLTVRVEP